MWHNKWVQRPCHMSKAISSRTKLYPEVANMAVANLIKIFVFTCCRVSNSLNHIKNKCGDYFLWFACLLFDSKQSQCAMISFYNTCSDMALWCIDVDTQGTWCIDTYSVVESTTAHTQSRSTPNCDRVLWNYILCLHFLDGSTTFPTFNLWFVS